MTGAVGRHLAVTSAVGMYGRVVMPVFMPVFMVMVVTVVTVTVVTVGVLMAIRVGAFACHMAYRGTAIRLRLLP